MRLPSAPQPHSLGFVAELAEVTVFFGNRTADLARLATAFPDYKLVQLNQTHSANIALSPEESAFEAADAHYTRSRKFALAIRTADCMPIMLHDPESGQIAAIHAGWRGIENEIIIKTCLLLAENGGRLDRARAWIGPHILEKSFEVGADVAARLESKFDAVRGFSSLATAKLAHSDPGKAYVNLLAIARGQLRSCGVEPERVTELAFDTKTSNQWASFRRDGANAGRNFSFIALK